MNLRIAKKVVLGARPRRFRDGTLLRPCRWSSTQVTAAEQLLIQRGPERRWENGRWCWRPRRIRQGDPVTARLLQGGCYLHGFLSGGGLRVLRLETTGDKLLAYGEAPQFDEALEVLAEDLEAGGIPYHEMYGKRRPEYWTGTCEVSSPADAWLRQGNTLDVKRNEEGDCLLALVSGYEHVRAPEDYTARAMAGETLTWESRGIVYCTSPSRFPNGEACASTAVVGGRKPKNGADPWLWHSERRGVGATLREALETALKAEPTEKVEP